MASSDVVPCFYTGQDKSTKPVMSVSRVEARVFKTQGRGRFDDNGKIFRFFEAVRKALWDGPFGIGNVLPFTRVQNKLRAPDSINYPIPCAGAHTRMLQVRLVNFVPELVPEVAIASAQA
jgi:hypothetical protein